jgi:hypothetical protein
MTPAPGRRLPPVGIVVFLGYAFVILGGIGVFLPRVIDRAIGTPVSLPGIAVMILLAYTIFTITMVFQRKQAARGLAQGLATLPIPAALVLLLAPVPAVAVLPAALAVLLFLGLGRPSVKDWLSEP